MRDLPDLAPAGRHENLQGPAPDGELEVAPSGPPRVSGERVFEGARQLGHVVTRTSYVTEDVGRQLLHDSGRRPRTGELEGEEEVRFPHAQILQ